MGSFLLVHRDVVNTAQSRQALIRATNIFAGERKLSLSGEFDLGDFRLFLYGKRFYDSSNFLDFKNGDFIASTGSLIYKGMYGKGALSLLFSDYTSGIKTEDHCKGHYCVIIRSKGKTWIFRDFFGLYPVYHTSGYGIISSSFLAVGLLVPKYTVSKAELYEYILNGYWYSDRTLLKEVTLLAAGGALCCETLEKISFRPGHESLAGKSYEERVKTISDSILKHFSVISDAVIKIRMGLSGGFDSRLILAGLIRNGVEPELYVNGTPGSMDIRCAVAIARGINLPIDEIRFYEEFREASERATEFFMNRFYHFDGLGTAGVFDNYSDLEYRLRYPVRNVAYLNGAGGEIYREAWNLPNRTVSIDSFISARYDKVDFDRILKGYTRQEYFDDLKKKIILNTGYTGSVIRRDEIELLHIPRYKAVHFIMSTQQMFNPFIMPFYEPGLIYQSFEIPVREKYGGRLNKDLIIKMDAKTASFQSAYGYPFDRPVPPKYRLKEFFITNTPLFIRPWLRRLLKSKKIPVRSFGFDLLSPELVEKILPGSYEFINDYIRVDQVNNEAVLSRALTVELLFRELGK